MRKFEGSNLTQAEKSKTISPIQVSYLYTDEMHNNGRNYNEIHLYLRLLMVNTFLITNRSKYSLDDIIIK